MIKIVGGGVVGLMAAGTIAANRPDKIIHLYDHNLHRSTLPPLFRFRDNLSIGPELKKVKVDKYVVPYSNPIADSLNYSYKVCGHYRLDRSIANLRSPVERWVPASPHFLDELIKFIQESYKSVMFFPEMSDVFDNKGYEAVISTIPLKHVMGDEFHTYFEPKHSFSYTQDIWSMHAYFSIYVPQPYSPVTRISATGSRLCIETNAPLTTFDAARFALPIPDLNGMVIQDFVSARHLESKFVNAPKHVMDEVFDRLWNNNKVLCLGRLARMESKFLAEHTIGLVHKWMRQGLF